MAAHSAPHSAHHHGHHHGVVDPHHLATERGIRAVQLSFLALVATALVQLVIAVLSGSVALLADTIHNVADAATALPLWLAFALARRVATTRFPYGFGRVEDLAGLAIVAIIALSALIAGWEAVMRLLAPQPLDHLWAVALAAVVGFLGNEAVAVFRIRVGRQIHSAALVADGYHARADGFVSLAVLLGVVGTALGFPLADPLVGLGITLVILRLVWEAARAVVQRALDGVDPHEVAAIRHALEETPGVQAVNEVRARWVGHRLFVEANVTAPAGTPIEEAHALAVAARHTLQHHLPYLADATIHVDPPSAAGVHHHAITQHVHDDLPPHTHPAGT
jgi:cation diffusion facilitator family transporter